MVLEPAKNAIKALESKTATLADCFVELTKMARAISKMTLQDQEFKKKCISIFNKRWKEFDTDIYMLAFFLHPKYRGKYIYINVIHLY